MKENVRIAALRYLIEKKNKSEIRKHIKYTDLEIAQYLQEDDFCSSVKEKQNLFASKICDLDVKVNRYCFPNLAIYQIKVRHKSILFNVNQL